MPLAFAWGLLTAGWDTCSVLNPEDVHEKIIHKDEVDIAFGGHQACWDFVGYHVIRSARARWPAGRTDPHHPAHTELPRTVRPTTAEYAEQLDVILPMLFFGYADLSQMELVAKHALDWSDSVALTRREGEQP